MKAKTVLKDRDHEDALHQSKCLGDQLDCPPKRFLPSIVDRWDRVADHDVAEEGDADGNESVEAEQNADEETSKTAEESSHNVAAMDWERWAIDEEDEGVAKDLYNAVADDHFVHSILLLLHDDHHRPGVEGEGEEEGGEGKPEIEATRDLSNMFMSNDIVFFQKFLFHMF